MCGQKAYARPGLELSTRLGIYPIFNVDNPAFDD